MKHFNKPLVTIEFPITVNMMKSFPESTAKRIELKLLTERQASLKFSLLNITYMWELFKRKWHSLLAKKKPQNVKCIVLVRVTRVYDTWFIKKTFWSNISHPKPAWLSYYRTLIIEKKILKRGIAAASKFRLNVGNMVQRSCISNNSCTTYVISATNFQAIYVEYSGLLLILCGICINNAQLRGLLSTS